VPLVVIFTKFDGQIASQFVNLTDANDEDKWEKAREIAEITFQEVYLPKVLNARYPPKAYVQLEDMDLPENNCPELTQQTADAIDDDSMYQLFVSTQMNNLDLCVKSALQWGSHSKSHLPCNIDIVQTCSKTCTLVMG
ncbi:hypothetical protein F5887DRAFT_879122, partial [Amanita rubescens]